MPSCGPPCTTLLQMSTKPVTKRATTATRAGCVQRGQGRETPGPKMTQYCISHICSAVGVARLAQNIRHSSTRVRLPLQWRLGASIE